MFFCALNMDKKYSTERIVGKKISNFEIKYFSKEDIFRHSNLTNENYHLINIKL